MSEQKMVGAYVPVVYTHMMMDLDALASAWAAKMFTPGMSNARVMFVPADWDGNGLTAADMAVDIDAGGRGVKGECRDGVVHSAFALLAASYASPQDQEALADLVRFIDTQDTYGSAYDRLLADVSLGTRLVFARTGIGSVLRAVQSMRNNNDPEVFRIMSEVLTGMLKMGRKRLLAPDEADKAEIVGNRVAIVHNSCCAGTNAVLFERGIEIVIYVDGYNLGVIRNSQGVSIRTDHPLIVAAVKAAGENLDEWFSHKAGFLFARGTKKSPAKNAPKVDPRALACAALAALEAG